MHQEPDMGFDPRSPGSHPGPKAGAKPLRHPGIPSRLFLSSFTNGIASILVGKPPWRALVVLRAAQASGPQGPPRTRGRQGHAPWEGGRRSARQSRSSHQHIGPKPQVFQFLQVSPRVWDFELWPAMDSSPKGLCESASCPL